MEIYNLTGVLLQQMVSNYELLELVNVIALIVITVGGIIVGTINLIQRKSKTAKEEAVEETTKDINQIHIDMNDLTERLEEMEKWRKDMNGQLKLMNERQKFTNQILEEQKNSLGFAVQSINTLSTNIAVMTETLKNHVEKSHIENKS